MLARPPLQQLHRQDESGEDEADRRRFRRRLRRRDCDNLHRAAAAAALERAYA
jgi:hypothetical protein